MNNYWENYYPLRIFKRAYSEGFSSLSAIVFVTNTNNAVVNDLSAEEFKHEDNNY